MTSAQPPIVLLGAPHALARAMAHALLQAWETHAPASRWSCLAPQPGEVWPPEAKIYVLGQDWRDSAASDPAARQIGAWRVQLAEQGLPYVMLYGKPAVQWLQLAESLKSIAPSADWNWISEQNPWKPSARMRSKMCEQCGDGDCERQLFEALHKPGKK
ncbi:hypothetical protein [Comamonas sp.]|uniref:hypothetical protein n=1 Tax=Comamonas sp. TaxID=34028 RepID=UPI003A91F315